MFLTASTSGLFLAACSSSDSDADSASGDAEVPFDPELQQLGIRFPDGFAGPSIFVAGDKLRAPFVPIAADGFPVTFGEPATIDMTVTNASATVFDGPVAKRRAGQSTPYYVLEFTPETAGTYTVQTSWSTTPRDILVVEAEQVLLPRVGQPMPAIDTPTFADARGVDPICTRLEPCPFHEVTLTEALTSAGPVAFLVATPGFCQTDVCGPSVELLIEAQQDFPEITVIHAEVYADPQVNVPPTGSLTEAITTLALDFEPSLFLVGSDGNIAEALHFAFDRDEIRGALAALG